MIIFPTLFYTQEVSRTTMVKVRGGKFFITADQENLMFNVNGIPTPEFDNFLPNPAGVLVYR